MYGININMEFSSELAIWRFWWIRFSIYIRFLIHLSHRAKWGIYHFEFFCQSLTFLIVILETALDRLYCCSIQKFNMAARASYAFWLAEMFYSYSHIRSNCHGHVKSLFYFTFGIPLLNKFYIGSKIKDGRHTRI